MKPSRWLNVLRRVTTAGPYVDGGLSMVVLTFVVIAGISAVGYADKSISSFSLAPLYFLPLALSALIHPLRISLALSVVCLGLHDLLGQVRDAGVSHITKDATALLGYIFVVIVVNQLGTQRRRLAEVAEKQATSLPAKSSWPRKYSRAFCLVRFPRCLDLSSLPECTQPR